VTRLLERVGGFFPAAVALALPLVFLPNLSDLFILPRASIVIAGACLGTGLALLVPTTNRLGAMRWPLIAAAAAAVLAFVFSVSWPLGLAGSYTRYESLPMRLAYLGLAASAAWLLRTELQRTVVSVAFVSGCSIAALQAVGQAASHVPFRPDGNLGNANLLAALLVMAIPIAVDRTLHASRILEIGAWAASLVVMGAGLLLTTSRSGFLGVLAAIPVLVVLNVPRRFVVPSIGLSLGFLGGAFALVQVFLNRLNNDPAQLRLDLWRDGLDLVLARPITGWGEDTTGLTFGHYLSGDYATLVTFDRIHSGPLDVAATQGILGLVATGVVVGVALLFAWRNRSRPHVAGLAAALAGYSMWVAFNFDWAPATGAFWLLLGVLWSAISNAPPHSWGGAGRSPAEGPGRGARSVIATALAAIALAFAVLPILADSWYVKGRADLAVKVDPLQAQYHGAIGSLPELRKAADLGATDPGLYVQLGDAELQTGNRANAISAYRRSLEIDPFYTPAYERLKSLGAI
jgi:O-antigen ligase